MDIESYVDWHERRVLLRTLFPLAVRSHETTCETMFGAVRRPTHHNTTWDATRFEVSAHRFCDLSEPGYGVALLNDGKYGHSAKGNVVGISLLAARSTRTRSPTRASIALRTPSSPTQATGPRRGSQGRPSRSTRPFSRSWRKGTPCRRSSLSLRPRAWSSLGSLKLAEDGEGMILRLYEPHGARGECTLRFARRVEWSASTSSKKPKGLSRYIEAP